MKPKWSLVLLTVVAAICVGGVTIATAETITTKGYWVLNDGYSENFTNEGQIRVSYGPYLPCLTEDVFGVNWPGTTGSSHQFFKYESDRLLYYGARYYDASYDTQWVYVPDSPVEFLPVALEVGNSYTCEWSRKEYLNGVYVGYGKDSYTITVSGPYATTVPAGTFTTHMFTFIDNWQTSSGGTGTTTFIYYLAKDIGWVKLIRGGVIYELVSHSGPPSAPRLSVTTSGVTVSPSWSVSVNADGYTLFYAPDASYIGPDSFKSIDMGTQTGGSFALWDGAAFYVAVQAYNPFGNSDYSNIEHFVIGSSLSVSPSSLSLSIGQTDTSCTISGGTSPYYASSSDTRVATVSVAGSTLSVTAVGAGSAAITVQDSTSGLKTVTVKVDPIPGKLPDTGQTMCYDWRGYEITCRMPGENLYGQDGNYTINPPFYTKLDSNGNDLSDSATSWTMVRDNVTGLIWEIKGNEDTLNYKNNNYTWQEVNELFIETLNASEFGGYSDWRLPTIKELASILDYGRSVPTIDTRYFPKTISAPYWSSTLFHFRSASAWHMNFTFGNAYYADDDSSFYPVRAVRGPQSESTLVDNGDGTVTDTSTGLMWQQSTSNEHLLPWTAALSYCENLPLAGYTDWRLPNMKELRTIVDYETCSPAINTDYFPDTMLSDYWSSTTREVFPSNAWAIDFTYGRDSDHGKTGGHYVRAVRGGQ
jgi:hypothetical protein